MCSLLLSLVAQAEVTDYVERAEGKDLVRVAVTVESDSQRGIMIGKGGSALKQLSTASRLCIEDFLGTFSCVDLRVGLRSASPQPAGFRQSCEAPSCC